MVWIIARTDAHDEDHKLVCVTTGRATSSTSAPCRHRACASVQHAQVPPLAAQHVPHLAGGGQSQRLCDQAQRAPGRRRGEEVPQGWRERMVTEQAAIERVGAHGWKVHISHHRLWESRGRKAAAPVKTAV